MTRVLLLPLLLLAACAPATTVERKEQVVQGALDGAFVACTAALGDPRVTWAKGAREYCSLIVNGGLRGAVRAALRALWRFFIGVKGWKNA